MKKRIAGILALTLAFATLLGGCGSKTVSYTHLDVYKRQAA